jgi:hypothetical protein
MMKQQILIKSFAFAGTKSSEKDPHSMKVTTGEKAMCADAWCCLISTDSDSSLDPLPSKDSFGACQVLP